MKTERERGGEPRRSGSTRCHTTLILYENHIVVILYEDHIVVILCESHIVVILYENHIVVILYEDHVVYSRVCDQSISDSMSYKYSLMYV